MKVICAWCKKDMGQKEPLEEDLISHGICPICVSTIEAEIHTLQDIFPVGYCDPQYAEMVHLTFQIS